MRHMSAILDPTSPPPMSTLTRPCVRPWIFVSCVAVRGRCSLCVRSTHISSRLVRRVSMCTSSCSASSSPAWLRSSSRMAAGKRGTTSKQKGASDHCRATHPRENNQAYGSKICFVYINHFTRDGWPMLCVFFFFLGLSFVQCAVNTGFGVFVYILRSFLFIAQVGLDMFNTERKANDRPCRSNVHVIDAVWRCFWFPA